MATITENTLGTMRRATPQVWSSSAELDQVSNVARKLATHVKRRVLLLLILAGLRKREPTVAADIATLIVDLLPEGHPGVESAQGASSAELLDADVEDLGEAVICTEVLSWLNPKGG